jgi:hypothetical protein
MNKPIRTDRLPWRQVDGRAVVINPRMQEVHDLNPAASVVWSLADGSRTVDELARELTERFDVAPETALADTREFISALEDRGLVNPR